MIGRLVKRHESSAGEPGAERHLASGSRGPVATALHPVRSGPASVLFSLALLRALAASLSRMFTVDWLSLLSHFYFAIFYNHKPVVHGPKLILRHVSLAYTVLFKNPIGLAAYVL